MNLTELKFTFYETFVMASLFAAVVWGATASGVAYMAGFEELKVFPYHSLLSIGSSGVIFLAMIIVALFLFQSDYRNFGKGHAFRASESDTAKESYTFTAQGTFRALIVLSAIAILGLIVPAFFVEKAWIWIADITFVIASLGSFFLLVFTIIFFTDRRVRKKLETPSAVSARAKEVKYTPYQTLAVATFSAGFMWTLLSLTGGWSVGVDEPIYIALMTPVSLILIYCYFRVPYLAREFLGLKVKTQAQLIYIAGMVVCVVGMIMVNTYPYLPNRPTPAPHWLFDHTHPWFHWTFAIFFLICVACYSFSLASLITLEDARARRTQ